MTGTLGGPSDQEGQTKRFKPTTRVQKPMNPKYFSTKTAKFKALEFLCVFNTRSLPIFFDLQVR